MADTNVLKVIPGGSDPWVAVINGEKYVYPAGTEQYVPPEVAVLIDAYWNKQEVDYPETGISFNDLRDRPFGESAEVLFDQTIDFAQENPYAGEYRVNEAWPINVGDTVVVTWDGVRYECVATTAPFDGVGFGDVSGMSGGESTGEPFSVIVSSEQQQSIIFAKDQTVHSVKVEAMEIKTLDPKFIPAGVGGGVTILYTNNDDPYVYKNTNYREEDKLTKSELLGYIRSGIVVIGNVGEAWEEYYYPDSAGTDDESNYSWVRTTNNGVFFSKEYVSEGGGEN